MAPPEKINLPLRWQFMPERHERDGSVRWRWRAYTQGGDIAMQSSESFETLTDCMADAKSHGYGR